MMYILKKDKSEIAIIDEIFSTTDNTSEEFSRIQSERQTGECNSQFGTMWITDGINNKKINSNEEIPEGWKKGRTLESNKDIKILLDKRRKEIENFKNKFRKSIERRNKIIQYKEWFELYNKVGFEEFCKITGYKYVISTLVKAFKRYIPDYEPYYGRNKKVENIELKEKYTKLYEIYLEDKYDTFNDFKVANKILSTSYNISRFRKHILKYVTNVFKEIFSYRYKNIYYNKRKYNKIINNLG